MAFNRTQQVFVVLSIAVVGLVRIGTASAATYTVTNINDSGAGSLRQAIIDSNNSAAADTITFAIPGTGPHSIQLASALPDITSSVIIDGYTQPGAVANTVPNGNNAVLMIELDGSDLGGDVSGLVINTTNSAIKGLAINGFGGAGVRVADGQVFNTIQGNFLGLDVNGVTLIGNDNGVDVSGNNNLVGGPCVECGNVIAGSTEDGVFVLDNSIRNRISRNSIFSNGGNDRTALGIELYLPSHSGANENDTDCDTDVGSNFMQNFPVLTSAESDGTSTTIIGFLESAPSTTFAVEFFANTACDKSGFGEGEIYIGTTNATTGAGAECASAFSATFPFAVADGTIITATATDPNGNTSEFSRCFAATGPQPHDFAVTKVLAPKRVNLREEGPAVTKKVKVNIQNRSPHDEIIPNAAVLADLLTVSVESLPPAGCANPTAVLAPPEAFPITLRPKKTLNVTYMVSFGCANDPLKAKEGLHNDYRVAITVDHAALDGIADDHPQDDVCPHAPLGIDPYPDGTIRDTGCGGKVPGSDVLIDIFVR